MPSSGAKLDKMPCDGAWSATMLYFAESTVACHAGGENAPQCCIADMPDACTPSMPADGANCVCMPYAEGKDLV